MNWFKNNWFKAGILLILLIAAMDYISYLEDKNGIEQQKINQARIDKFDEKLARSSCAESAEQRAIEMFRDYSARMGWKYNEGEYLTDNYNNMYASCLKSEGLDE